MESPVRICLSAVIVVYLLFLNSCNVSSSAIPPSTPPESEAANLNVRRSKPGYVRVNSTTWVPRVPTTDDPKINDINPKEMNSQESPQAKDERPKTVRGSVRYNANQNKQKFKPSTTISRRRTSTSSTVKPDVELVTPTPEKKNMSQVMDSMRTYKNSKLVKSSTTSTTAMPEVEDEEEEDDGDETYTNDDATVSDFDITKYISSEFHDSENVFTFSSTAPDDMYPHRTREKENKPYKDYSRSPFEGISSKTRKDTNSGESNKFKQNTSHSYDNFFSELDLTKPPKNDRFDKRYTEISQSITKNIDKHNVRRTKSDSVHSENIEGINLTKSLNVEEYLNKKPSTNSQMFFHKTKSIQVSDNEAEGSSLSDVQGTSIYFETSMLSTESYGPDIITEGDCDNDTRTEEPATSTPASEEVRHPSLVHQKTTSSITPTTESSSTSTNYPTRGVRVSPKRLNFSVMSNKETTNGNLKAEESSSNNLLKPTVTRRIQFTTPKSRITYRISVKSPQSTRPSYPTTIYAEHFNIKNKSSDDAPERRHSLLTTVSSDIDPVYETEISGTKKVVHTHTISDNSIPGLRKRGSTKFAGSSTADPSSTEDASSSNMALPTASSSFMALAGMRNPPSLSSPGINATASSIIPVDENELQNVAESINNHPPNTSATPVPKINRANADMTHSEPTGANQQWTPLYVPPQTITTEVPAPVYTETEPIDIITARPLESPPTTLLNNELIQTIKDEPTIRDSPTTKWIPVNDMNSSTTEVTPMASNAISTEDTKPEVSLKTSSKREHESISKLPSNTTTPQNDVDDATTVLIDSVSQSSSDTNASTSVPSSMQKDSDEVTTYRYVPIPTIAGTAESSTTNSMEESTTITILDTIPPEVWHPVLPARKVIPVTQVTQDIPITTYRPTYMATDITETETVVENQNIATTEGIYTPISIVTNEDVTTTKSNEIVTMINVEYTVRRETTTAATTLPTVDTKTIPASETTTETVTTSEAEKTTTALPKEEPTTTLGVQLTDANKESTFNMQPTELVTPEFTTESIQSNPTTKMMTTEMYTAAIPTEAATQQTTEEEITMRTVSKLEDLTSNFADDLTTHSPYDGPTEPSSAAGVAIAVSTIGVIALLLLIGLLLVLRRRRRRGRRCGVYAQRCTPVSLDAYSLDSVSVGRRKGAAGRMRASKRSYGNPAYDDEVVISHPMEYAALANFALNSDSMTAEFTEIPAPTVRADEVPPGCEDKNRYSNVLPLPETRVPLSRIGTDPTTEYINANYVSGPGNIKNYYIACQAPLASTVADFWRMVWEQNSRLIVMLTEYMENGVEKCYEYLPPSEVTDNKRIFADFQVVLKRREHKDKYAVSCVELTQLSTGHWREVAHLWYFWPATGVPEDYDSVISFLSEMRSHMKIAQNGKEFDENGEDAQDLGSATSLSKLKEGSPGAGAAGRGVNVYSPARAEEQMRKANGTNGTLGRIKAAAEIDGVRPCVVTCASGAGRTGALLALDVCARALETSGAVDVPRAVRLLRSARPHALQNKAQYMFLYKVLSEYGNRLTGGAVDSI